MRLFMNLAVFIYCRIVSILFTPASKACFGGFLLPRREYIFSTGPKIAFNTASCGVFSLSLDRLSQDQIWLRDK